MCTENPSWDWSVDSSGLQKTWIWCQTLQNNNVILKRKLEKDHELDFFFSFRVEASDIHTETSSFSYQWILNARYMLQMLEVLMSPLNFCWVGYPVTLFVCNFKLHFLNYATVRYLRNQSWVNNLETRVRVTFHHFTCFNCFPLYKLCGDLFFHFFPN